MDNSNNYLLLHIIVNYYCCVPHPSVSYCHDRCRSNSLDCAWPEADHCVDLDSFELPLLHMVQWYESGRTGAHTHSIELIRSTNHSSQWHIPYGISGSRIAKRQNNARRQWPFGVFSLRIFTKWISASAANRIFSSNGVYLIAINLHIVNTALTRTRSNRSASNSRSRATINCVGLWNRVRAQ